MAVELAKLSMWLFTMDPGRPLSFVDHHLKTGNAIVGASMTEVTQLQSDRSTGFRQAGLFDEKLRSAVPMLVRDIFAITARETVTPQDVEDKKTLDRARKDVAEPFASIGDAWIALQLGSTVPDYLAFLANPQVAVGQRSRPSAIRFKPSIGSLNSPQRSSLPLMASHLHR